MLQKTHNNNLKKDLHRYRQQIEEMYEFQSKSLFHKLIREMSKAEPLAVITLFYKCYWRIISNVQWNAPKKH